MTTATINAEKAIELAARNCYNSINKINDNSHSGFLQKLMKMGHMSVFEHASAQFVIDSVSRALMSQLTRHRLASYGIQSQRYVTQENFSYVLPPSIEADEFLKLKIDNHLKQTKDIYNQLLEYGIKKEDARFILPNATSTTIVMSANFREWLHIIDERVSKPAQWEIRNMMIDIWKKLYSEFPNIFDMTYFDKNSADSDYKSEVFAEFIN